MNKLLILHGVNGQDEVYGMAAIRQNDEIIKLMTVQDEKRTDLDDNQNEDMKDDEVDKDKEVNISKMNKEIDLYYG